MPRPKVYLDSNVIITAFENAGARSDHAWWLLHAIDEGRILAATSEITIPEVLVKPFEVRDEGMISTYQTALSPSANFEVVAITREILIDAARIRAARKSIKLPDAIHIATAKVRDCQFFVSGDHRLDMPAGMTQFALSPFSLDDVLKA